MELIKSPTTVDIIYAAGLMDGEACISIVPKHWFHSRGETTSYYLQLSMSLTFRPTIEWVRETFGGYVHVKKPRKRDAQSYQWQTSEISAARVIAMICPYMKIKRREAELALEFHSLKKKQEAIWKKMPRGCQGVAPMPIYMMEERKVMHFQMKSLKRDYRIYADGHK